MNRQGVALLLAIFALVIVEALTAGVLAVTLQSQHVAAARARIVQSRIAAGAELARTIARWDQLRADTLLVGARLRASDYVTVERTGPASFLFESQVNNQRQVATGRVFDRDRAITELRNRIVPDSALALSGIRWSDFASLADPDTLAGPSLLYFAGDAFIGPGARRGVIISEGGIVFDGTRFDGVAIARGMILLVNGANVTGVARSARYGGYSVAGVTRSDSVAASVLMETPSPARLIMQQRRYIPAF